jgi:effector-binding domain-containing protein
MEIIERAETPTLSVRYRTPAAELPNTMGPIYGEIAGHMAKNGIPFAGPPYARYFNMDMADLDVEIGFPVAAPAAGAGRVAASKLPGGTYRHRQAHGPLRHHRGRTYNRLMAS